jgi:hypothetical protein
MHHKRMPWSQLRRVVSISSNDLVNGQILEMTEDPVPLADLVRCQKRPSRLCWLHVSSTSSSISVSSISERFGSALGQFGKSERAVHHRLKTLSSVYRWHRMPRYNYDRDGWFHQSRLIVSESKREADK